MRCLRRSGASSGAPAVIVIVILALLGAGVLSPAWTDTFSDTAQRGREPEKTLASGFTSDLSQKYVFRGLEPQKYVFRGLEFDGDRVFQYSAWVTLAHLSLVDELKAVGFANMDHSGTPNEWDLLVEATETLLVNEVPVTLKAGYGLYKRGHMEIGADMTTQEVYGLLKVTTLLNPTVTIIRDVDMIEGTYAELSIDHGVSGDSYGVRFSAKIGYNDNYYCREEGLSHREFGVEIPVFADRHATITPYARAVNPWDLNTVIDNHFVSGIRIDLVF
jgi:hypothetical protein